MSLFFHFAPAASTASAFLPQSLFTGVRDGWCFNTAGVSPLFEDAAGTTAALDAGDVLGMAVDYSPSGRHAKNNNTPSKAILRVDANGVKSIEVTSAGNQMLRSESVFPAYSGPYTWYIVGNYTTPAIASGGLQGTGTNLLDIIYNYPGATQTCLREGGNPVANAWNFDLAAAGVFIAKIQHTSDLTNNGILKIVGGSTNTVTLTNGLAIGNGSNSYINLGTSSGGNATMRICFDMLITDVLSAEEEANLEAYLLEEFGGWLG